MGKTKYFAIRVQFQVLDSNNVHWFLRIWSAPVLNKVNENEYVFFVDTRNYRDLSNKNNYPDLLELVNIHYFHTYNLWYLPFLSTCNLWYLQFLPISKKRMYLKIHIVQIIIDYKGNYTENYNVALLLSLLSSFFYSFNYCEENFHSLYFKT